MKHFTIIGGGIVGLATAYRLRQRRPDAAILVLEKEPEWAFHQTGRNSGVIHSGIYYKPGSYKARLCREGNVSLKRFCTENGIAFQNTGKLIVATVPEEMPALDSLEQRGRANGVAVTRLNPEQVREREPAVRCLAGLHVPSTAIVSYRDVCAALVRHLEQTDVTLLRGTRVLTITPKPFGHLIGTDQGDFETAYLINCAGLQSDRIARLNGQNPDCRIIPFRGEYYELTPETRNRISGLIYPTPPPQFPFLGVHLTKMMDGSVHVGPNAVLSLKREGYSKLAFDLRDTLDTAGYPGFWKLAAKHRAVGVQEMIRSFWKPAFVRDLQRMVPEITEKDLLPSGSGVRAQALRPDGGLVDDFFILQTANAIHVCNAPSPAATASLEIASEIIAMLPAGAGQDSAPI